MATKKTFFIHISFNLHLCVNNCLQGFLFAVTLRVTAGPSMFSSVTLDTKYLNTFLSIALKITKFSGWLWFHWRIKMGGKSNGTEVVNSLFLKSCLPVWSLLDPLILCDVYINLACCLKRKKEMVLPYS